MQLDTNSGLYLPTDYVDRRGTLEDPSVPLTDFDRISEMTGGSASDSGVRVGAYTILTYGPVFRAVTLIAGDVAKIPLFIYRRTTGEGKIRAFDHPAYQLLRYEPNELMTAATFWNTMALHRLLWGNFYSLIETDGAGNPTALLPLLPDRTEPWIDPATGQLWYKTRIGNVDKYFYPDEVLHVPGLAFDGLKGYSVLSLAKNSVGLGLAAEKFAAKFYRHGAKASGVLMTPRGLSKPAQENLERSFEEKHTSLDKAHRVILLEEGAKFIPLSIPPNEAQFLETRQQQVRETALWFGVPPHKLGDNSRTAYNSLEEENASYVSDTLDATFVPIEQECRRKLLTKEQRKRDTHVIEFQRQALLRSKMSERYTAYAVGITNGFLSRDEVRAAENYNAIPGGKGKEYLVPLNMGPAGGAPKDPAEPEAKAALLADTLRRMAGIEAQQLERLAKNSETFDSKILPALAMHRDRLEAALLPVLDVVAPRASARELAGEWMTETKHRIAELAERETPFAELAKEITAAIAERAARFAQDTMRQEPGETDEDPES